MLLKKNQRVFIYIIVYLGSGWMAHKLHTKSGWIAHKKRLMTHKNDSVNNFY